MIRKLLLFVRSLFYSTENNCHIVFFDHKKVSSSKMRFSHLLFVGLFALFSVNFVGAQAASSTWVLTSTTTAPPTVTGNITANGITSNGVNTISYNASGATSTGWTTNSSISTDYYEFVVTPNTNTVFNVSEIKFDHSVSNGTWQLQAYYSTDGFATSTALGASFNSTTTIQSVNYSSINIPVNSASLTVRIYGWNSGNTNRSLRIRNFVISGTTCAKANAGIDQYSNNSSFTLAANTPTSGTGTWSIVSGPNTSTSQFASLTNPTTTFTPIGSGTWVLNWAINNCGSSTDQVVIANCVSNLISNGDFTNSSAGNNLAANWTFATSKGSYVETQFENTYFATGNTVGFTAELDAEASLRQNNISVVPGVSYTVSFLYARRPTAGTPATTNLDIKITGGAVPISSPTLFATSSTPATGTFTFTPTSSLIGIEFYNSLSGTSTLGTIIDDIVLLPTSQVAPVATTVPKGVFKTLTSCAGVPVQLDVDNVTASGVTYAWTTTSPGAVFSSTNIKNPTITFTGSGIQEATVVATTAGGCSSSASTIYVNVTAAPTAYAVTGGGSYCSGGTGVAVGLANSTTGVNYQLQIGGVNTGTSIAGTTGSPINFGLKTAAGTYTVVATNPTTTCSSNMTGNAVITINQAPAALSYTFSTQSYCIGTPISTNSATLATAGTPAAVFAISPALPAGLSIDTSTGSITGTPTASASAANYTVTASNTCGNTTAVINLTVNAKPATPTASVTTQPTCTVPTGVITITNPAPAAGITYSIDGTTYTNTTGVFSGLAAGSYNVTAKNSSGCESSITVVPVNAYVSKTWNGSVSTNWNTAGNWTPSGVPTADDCVVIPDLTSIANKPEITGTNTEFKAHTINLSNNSLLTVQSTNTLTVTNAVTVNTGSSLTFENNASLVQKTNAVNSGNITYKRNTQLIRRYDFTYWSAPVTAVPGITLHDLSPTTLADKYYSYNPNTGWTINYNGTLVMAPGQGYIVRSPQEYDINTSAVYQASFTGVPNNGDITFTPTAAKWNLIGNPYPSAIDAYKLINDTGVGALYFWTHNSPPNGSVAGDAKYNYTVADYAVYTLTGSVATTSGAAAPTGSIAAGQGFFFKASTGSNIVFTNDMRIAGDNTQFFKTSETAGEANRLWLNFTNAEGAFKQALIGYINGATNSWDQNYDAATLNGNTYVDFYSISDAKKLTVQGRALPFEDTDLIPLGYKTAVAGEFTISIDHTDGLLNNQAVYLEDKTTGTVYDLKAGNYKFTTEIGTFTDRFTLRYTNKTLGTGDFENVKDGLLVSVKDKTIKVTSSKENIKEVNIFDITGRLLYSKNKVGTAELSIPNLQAADQVLLVKTTLENKAEATRKIIFK
ncbi:T9SS sorting signal type C domain-containing protein [Flavobacterium soyae]|uniref:T9SS sorting signal type C domain-containing protein n=1 Tax=Flavobacterium soyae TaxID=2903098 RepID=A0ABZ2ULI1_9FLAO